MSKDFLISWLYNVIKLQVLVWNSVHILKNKHVMYPTQKSSLSQNDALVPNLPLMPGIVTLVTFSKYLFSNSAQCQLESLFHILKGYYKILSIVPCAIQ